MASWADVFHALSNYHLATVAELEDRESPRASLHVQLEQIPRRDASQLLHEKRPQTKTSRLGRQPTDVTQNVHRTSLREKTCMHNRICTDRAHPSTYLHAYMHTRIDDSGLRDPPLPVPMLQSSAGEDPAQRRLWPVAPVSPLPGTGSCLQLLSASPTDSPPDSARL